MWGVACVHASEQGIRREQKKLGLSAPTVCPFGVGSLVPTDAAAAAVLVSGSVALFAHRIICALVFRMRARWREQTRVARTWHVLLLRCAYLCLFLDSIRFCDKTNSSPTVSMFRQHASRD